MPAQVWSLVLVPLQDARCWCEMCMASVHLEPRCWCRCRETRQAVRFGAWMVALPDDCKHMHLPEVRICTYHLNNDAFKEAHLATKTRAPWSLCAGSAAGCCCKVPAKCQWPCVLWSLGAGAAAGCCRCLWQRAIWSMGAHMLC